MASQSSRDCCSLLAVDRDPRSAGKTHRAGSGIRKFDIVDAEIRSMGRLVSSIEAAGRGSKGDIQHCRTVEQLALAAETKRKGWIPNLTYILILFSLEKYALANCSPSLQNGHSMPSNSRFCLSAYLRVDSMILKLRTLLNRSLTFE